MILANLLVLSRIRFSKEVVLREYVSQGAVVNTELFYHGSHWFAVNQVAVNDVDAFARINMWTC